GKHNHLYRYDIAGGSWTYLEQDTIPLTHPDLGKKNKVGDGGAMATDGACLYAIKGGGKQDFWVYDPTLDSARWRPLPVVPMVPEGNKKSTPKTGAAIAYCVGKIYLMKGNKTDEFWRYVPQPTEPIVNNSTSSTVTTLNSDNHSTLNLSVRVTTYGRIINYTIPTNGYVSMKLYNASGRLVKTIVNGYVNAGDYTTLLSNISSGVYFLKYNDAMNNAEFKIIVQ
ncbi:MAG: T9SS type A sorting domain-containing protein, partial [candidate division WOR-3 bacterium]